MSCSALCFSLVTGHWSLVTAAQLPSLFRGVVVADSPLGVRVVSVEATSQAYLADLRPEDLIVRVHDREVHSIDEFAALSQALQGRAVSATVLVFRNGAPREVTVHLYSYPVLREWGIEFLPEHDMRFAQSSVGGDYWVRLGRGFEGAGKDADALQAYLNSLHNVPTDAAIAVKIATLFARIGQQRLREGSLAAGLGSLRQGMLVMQKLFEHPLTEEQLRTIKEQLHETLRAIKQAAASPPKKSRTLANQTAV